ncbi:g7591 [Coccomyxa viridis]|uniref:G7591 protein n=1 Tax=Coccomyxa viridis TaxID=1274662 RepID=A0ABP1G4V2_9CHLO
MSMFGGVWDQLVDCICRPPRDEYTVSQLPGGEGARFAVSGVVCSREDMNLMSDRKVKLECSLFTPEVEATCSGGGMPLVIYCHCNSGSRRDSEEALHLLMPAGIRVFALDFAGSGRSGGDYVTLGAHEVNDLGVAVAYLRERFPVCTIGLWGRSMGAVTALLYSQKDPSIAGIVLDSPFSRLRDLMVELCEEQKLPIPRAFMRIALSMMRRSVRRRANFSIDEVSPLDVVPGSFIPALFGHAEQDTFVNKAHSEKLHKAYAGDKNLITFEGDHNSHRPQFFYTSVLFFLKTVLQMPVPEQAAAEAVASASGQPSASDRNAEKEEMAVVERTLSVPWICGPGWEGSDEDLQLAWAAEMSRGIYNGDVRLAHASAEPDKAKSTKGAQLRTMSEPLEVPAGSTLGASMAAQRDIHSDSATSETPVALDQAQLEQQQKEAELAAARREAKHEARRAEEKASRKERWRLMQDEEDELLAQALDLSLEQEQRRTGRPGSRPRRPAGCTRTRDHYVPESLAGMSEEDAEEVMLVQAIQASLGVESEGNTEQLTNGTHRQEGEHSAADVGASKGRPDKDLAQGGFPSNAHDSFSVTPLLTKEDTAHRGGLLDTQVHPQPGEFSHSADTECEELGASEGSSPSGALERSSEDELEDMFKRAADAAARGDYSAAAAGRFLED